MPAFPNSDSGKTQSLTNSVNWSDAASKSSPRLVEEPRTGKGYALCRLCTARGRLEEVYFTKNPNPVNRKGGEKLTMEEKESLK